MKFHIRVRACALIIQEESVLLIEFQDENGLHYNLPAGGVEPNESVVEAVKREAREEASVDINVGRIAFVYEYAPHLASRLYDPAPHGLSLIFDCTLKEGSSPRMPEKPDPNQTAVKWIPLSELGRVTLYPNIKKHIVEYVRCRSNNIMLIEEHELEPNE